MTREEAIKLLKHINIAYTPTDAYGDYYDPQPYEEALDMAIEALQEPKTIIGIDIPYGSDKGIATVFKGKDDKLILEEVKELMRSWIPCSERLPDAEYGEGDSVLCCTESGLMYILYWNGGNWCVPTGEPHNWVNHKTGWHDKVIAWVPLPEPYDGGDTE